MGLKISEIETTFKEVFQEEEGLVSSVDSVYELSENEEFYKLVISIHSLSIQDTLIIHTKFIFKTNLDKTDILDNSFIYLYDINCNYKKVDFTNIVDLKKKIEDIIETNDFGQDIKILSDFIEAPSMFLNYYLKRSKITEYSIFDVIYDPKFKTVPCEEISFDFKVNVNNNYNIELSISKKDKEEPDDIEIYKFKYKFLDKYWTKESDTIQNIHFLIGSHIAKILDEKLK
jgi:hypothetical protein